MALLRNFDVLFYKFNVGGLEYVIEEIMHRTGSVNISLQFLLVSHALKHLKEHRRHACLPELLISLNRNS